MNLLSATVALAVFSLLFFAAESKANDTFDITKFGATPDDDTDDTAAIEKALAACGEAGGGTVLVPAGVFLISRHGAESPILEVPSDTTIRGEGNASTIKYTAAVNEGNFWRMIGAPVATGAKNVVIRDLHLDGSNKWPAYVKGETREHNSGLWFYNKEYIIENVSVMNVFAENFSGDCMAFSYNCRGITVRDCTLKNFLRQGIQMGGSEGSRDYLVTGCRDLEHTVKPGGSTIHVEHARGLKNVIIENNQCRKSILAGGVDGLIIRGNTIDGRLVGNGNTNQVIEGNVVRSISDAGSIMQLGYCRSLIIRGNIIEGNREANKVGIYVWGKSRYNDQPGEDVVIADNQVSAGETGVSLNGVKNVTLRGNQFTLRDAGEDGRMAVLVKRAEGVVKVDGEVLAKD